MCPWIVCDYCRQIIKYAALGLVKENFWGDVLVVHKGECDRLSPGGVAPNKWPWQPLDTFWIYLANNMKIDFENPGHRIGGRK
jgi:hypothetical protein